MDGWLATLGVVVGVLGTAAAILAVLLARGPHRDAQRSMTVGRFLDTRQHLKEHGPRLVELALVEHSGLLADREIPLLTRPGWIPPTPIPLDGVVLRRVGRQPPDRFDAALAKLRGYWPIRPSGERMERYHEAVATYDKPTNWFNGASYRLLEVATRERTVEMTFTDSRYWDMFDTTEALLYEAALMHARSRGKKISGPYRRYLRDPFDLVCRCAIPGVDALTIRRDQRGGTFYLHRRDAAHVASALNVTGIVPAGEFQPSDESRYAIDTDFNLWRSIVREYVEEFLGQDDARKRLGAPIDYLHQPPYSRLHAVYQRGKVTAQYLGIGLDPVTWKPTILTVCIFDADVFDKLFREMVRDNGEGVLELPARARVRGGAFQGWPFEQMTVRAYADDPAVLPAARAGLMLAWRFREQLGLARPR